MRVVIAGAGKVGRSIAKELVANGHDVLLIDRDPECIRPESIPGAEWLQADACEIAVLEGMGLERCQVVVAATGDDKVNLVMSLLAKTEYGVPRVVARVNHPKNEWMFDESWGVDVAVSTPRMLSALVEEAVSIGDLVRLFEFRQGAREPRGAHVAAGLRAGGHPGRETSPGRPTPRWSRSCGTAGCSPRAADDAARGGRRAALRRDPGRRAAATADPRARPRLTPVAALAAVSASVASGLERRPARPARAWSWARRAGSPR